MKLASYTTLSAAAAVLLQLGTFVHANPMFEEHNDAASTDDNCQGELLTRIVHQCSPSLTRLFNPTQVLEWLFPQAQVI